MDVAEFVERAHCINCRSAKLKELATGLFSDKPLHDFIANDPWGESPVPYLEGKRWSYVQCEDCGQAFHRYVLSPEWNERRFSRWMTQDAIERFAKLRTTPAGLFQKGARNTAHVIGLEKLTRDLRGHEKVRILDFGCGYGEFLAMCSLYGFESYGIDRSSARRDHGRYSSVFAELDDLQNSEAGAKAFHAITLFEVLEHLDDPRAILEALSKLIVVGGILILETPDCTGVTNITTRNDYDKIHPLEHINGFTPQTLQSFAERFGFSQIQPPTIQVTSDPMRVAKIEIKRLVGKLLKPTTQKYFRKKI
ncbi:MAG: class I SAM-dependent methyltransferase [Sulfuricaulis sp.]